jgi:DNA repair exonuclease SbcCD ATPase subunit
MIVFRSVSFSNFLSYGNIPTEIKLDQHPTTLLIGESGSGKSTITDAISFALFGKPFRPINKNLITNTINNKNCLVEIAFSVGVVEYRVRRGIKPNVFEIYQNDKLLNQESHTRDYQEYLEKSILGMNYHSFSQIVILGTANFTPFMQMKAADRRSLIEDLLDIQIFSVMVSLLKEKIYDTKKSIDNCDLQINLITEKAKLQAKYIIQIEKNCAEQVEVHKKTIDETRKQITMYEQNVVSCESQISELQQLILDEKDVISKVAELSENKRSIEYNKRGLEDNKHRLEANIKRLNQELIIYESTKECPTCRRAFDIVIDPQIIKKFQTEISSSKEGIEQIQKAFEQIKEELDQNRQAAASVQERYEEIRKIKSQIQVIEKKKLLEEANISSSNSLIPRLEKAIKDLQDSKNDSTKEREALKALKQQIKEEESNKNKLSEYYQTLEIASKILKDGGVKTQIIKQYLPIINKLVNRFLAAMNFNVMFYIDENFEEIIKRRGRDVLTYYSLSEGERQRLDIAILLTWRTIATMKNSINTNLLFVDELLDSSLDQSATENIIELMTNEQTLKNSNIFVISHKSNIVDKFSNFLKFEMYKNFSRIVQND